MPLLKGMELKIGLLGCDSVLLGLGSISVKTMDCKST